MTYSATERILFQATETGRLLLRQPLRPLPGVRKLYLTPEVCKILDGEDERFSHLPTLETEAIIGRFCAGHLVSVSLSGDGSRRPDFERLSGLDEVWAMCARKPRIFQVRILGRFIDAGVFLGLGLYERSFLGIRERYNMIASDIPQQWAATIGSCDPYRADTVGDYFGGVWRDVDDKE